MGAAPFPASGIGSRVTSVEGSRAIDDVFFGAGNRSARADLRNARRNVWRNGAMSIEGRPARV